MGRFAQSRNEKHQNHHKLRKSNSTSVTTGKNRELIYPAKGHSNSGKKIEKESMFKALQNYPFTNSWSVRDSTHTNITF